jgi:hypothetical protein
MLLLRLPGDRQQVQPVLPSCHCQGAATRSGQEQVACMLGGSTCKNSHPVINMPQQQGQHRQRN